MAAAVASLTLLANAAGRPTGSHSGGAPVAALAGLLAVLTGGTAARGRSIAALPAASTRYFRPRS